MTLAPITSLTGRATVQTEALDRPVDARVELSNDAAGRWNDGHLPLRSLKYILLALFAYAVISMPVPPKK